MKKSDNSNFIYLFRHGQTTFNRDKIFTGFKDAQLTKKGIENARFIAKLLKKKRIDVAIHSHLTRSKDTLKYVLRFHPECKLIIEDDRIIERSYGVLEGTSHEEFIKRIGKQEVDLLIEGDAVENLEPELMKKVEEFLGEQEYNAIHRGYNVSILNGESFKDVEKRVRPFINDLKRFIKKNKVNVAISAHGNSIRLFRKIIEKKPVKEIVKWNIPYDEVFVYRV